MSLTLNDIKHPRISTWVNEMIAMCEPDNGRKTASCSALCRLTWPVLNPARSSLP